MGLVDLWTMTLTIKYLLFAILATGINISVQYTSLSIYGGRLYLAMFCGTLPGLIVKFKSLHDERISWQFAYGVVAHNILMSAFANFFTHPVFLGQIAFHLWLQRRRR